MATRGSNRTTRPAAQTETTPEETTPEETTGATGTPDEQDSPGGPDQGTAPTDLTAPAMADASAQGVPQDEGPEPTWADVVPLIALMVGAAPSPEESQAARLLWTVLADTPQGVTAGAFVRRAEEEDWPEIETTTIKSVLSRYERVGMVRCEQTDKGRQRWTLGSPSDVVATVATVGARPRSARTSALTVPATRTASVREGHWAPGELKAAVAAHVHEHPGEAFKAQAVCDGIGTHQHGSVRAALDSLTRAGEVVQVTDSPRSWQSARA